MRVIFFTALFGLSLMLSACGGGGGSSSSSSPTPTSSGGGVTSVKISGQITYDFVPHNPTSFGLDYINSSAKPVRGVVIELVDNSNNVISQTITNGSGHYEFTVEPQTHVEVRVTARLEAANTDQWSIDVRDNTQNNTLYVVEDGLTSSGQSATQSRDIHLASGWTGTAYTHTREAAPFAILDPLYTSVEMLSSIDPSMTFPELNVFWSPENRPTVGSKSQGHIGTTSYVIDADNTGIYVLGKADMNTDEYDPHVIAHEFSHYFEHNFSRYDTLGGLHNLGDKLDPRVAFSEGLAHAFAAIVTDDPVFKDSVGPNQSSGLSFNLETVNRGMPGWFNETSVAAIIYDIYDTESDPSDFISAGLTPIYQALTSDSFQASNTFATIYSFIEALSLETSVNASDLSILLSSQNISGYGFTGIGEGNTGGIFSTLPVYKNVVPNGPSVTLCSVDDAGTYNKLGNREFIQLTLPTDADYQLTMTSVTGSTARDPDFLIWKDGVRLAHSQSAQMDSETHSDLMEAGDYLIEAYDFYNINGVSSNRGDACFELTVTST